MSRATTKSDLQDAATTQFDSMWTLINSMTEEEQCTSFNFDEATLGKEAHWNRDKNIRDVLIHLFEWHKLLLHWVTENQKGIATPFLPPPYNWKTYGQMNVAFFEKHQVTPYEKSKEMVKKSHEEVLSMIEGFSNDELFSKKYFTWTGTTTLGSYCVSATSSHYDWAMKKIKKHKKSMV